MLLNVHHYCLVWVFLTFVYESLCKCHLSNTASLYIGLYILYWAKIFLVLLYTWTKLFSNISLYIIYSHVCKQFKCHLTLFELNMHLQYKCATNSVGNISCFNLYIKVNITYLALIQAV